MLFKYIAVNPALALFLTLVLTEKLRKSLQTRAITKTTNTYLFEAVWILFSLSINGNITPKIRVQSYSLTGR